MPRKSNNSFDYGKKESTLTPVIVLVNILIVVVLAVMAFFIYRYITEEETEYAARPATPPVTTEPPVVTVIETSPAAETLAPPKKTTAPPEMTKAVTTSPPIEEEDVPEADTIFEPAVFSWETVGYNEEFFESDLFIGDSLSVGLLDFSLLPSGNLFTKIGLNPVNIADAQVSGVTVYNKVQTMQPKRIFIMLGTNGMDYLPGNVMTSRMDGLINDLRELSPDSQIVIMSIPPVTYEYETTNDKDINMENINAYNSLLKDLAAENDYIFVDTSAILTDDRGYLANPPYAERDGMHLLPAAYKAMLSFIQKQLED